MRRKRKELKVLFNASVVLAGLKSPSGASGELIKRVRAQELAGVVSELILEEVERHADKIGLSAEEIQGKVESIFEVCSAPEEGVVERYKLVVTDFGDAHVLASAIEEKCGLLVSLDKKHILILKGRVEKLRIVTPGELLQKLNLT